jgi:protein-S-isoprenylcysteine O-methyltransferase Ste14
MLIALHLALVLWMAVPFSYFISAGANIFTVPKRHPFYLSYMLAFLGVAVAFPSVIVSGVCLLNMGLFVYMVMDDERVLLVSTLGADYKSYKMRVGMFLPRFTEKR